MQNFGRGMWRRVGDFERIHKPILIQQSRLEQWQQFIQHQTYKQQYMEQNSIQTPKQLDTKVVQDISIEEQDISIEENKSESTEENEIKQNIDIIEIQEAQQEYSEQPVVIPKKTKRKNKK
jgi:hypothetical protein